MRAPATGKRHKREGNIASEIAYGVLLAFCTASCVVCSREFIVLYLDRRYSAAAAASRGDRRLSTRGDGERKKLSFDFHGSVNLRRRRVAELSRGTPRAGFRKTTSPETKAGDIKVASPASIIDWQLVGAANYDFDR